MKKTIKILIILNIFLIPFICETQYLMYFNILYQLLQFSSLIYLIMKLKGSRRSYLFALVFSTILLGIQSQQLIVNHHFPRFIWTFWEGEVNIITQLCFNNMKYYAEKRDWKFTALNSKSFEQSLSENTLQLFQNIKKKGGYKTSKLADLIRCFILFEKGGIWLDASTFLTQDMSWLENIDKDLIAYNRISKYPQVICYTYNGINGGNKTVIFDKQLNKEIVIMPGLQNWAIISKPKSKFLTDVIKLYKVNALDKKQTQTQIISHYVNEGYQYRYQADPYFLFGNFHLQTVLQMKQKEIDKNPKNFQTKYAVQYYQMWLIKGQETAILFSWLHDSLRLTKFFQKLFYSLDQKQANQMKAVKLTKFPRNEVNLFIQFSPYLICSKIIPLFPKSSYIYNYTLSFQQNEPNINYFKRLHENPQQICQQLISSQKIYIYLGLFSLILFMICFLINFIVDKIGIKMNQYRNQNPSQQYNMVAQQD